MCGIGGFQGHFDAGVLPAMCKMLAHRGPDNEAFTYDAATRVGLAHTRLSIIDLSPRSNQPLWDATGRYCLVFNGEIYNYRELRNELVAEGAKFLSDGDGEIILNLYMRHGVEALRRLNGIFAFAIWDKSSAEVLIARDQFGVKPLYYAAIPHGVIFASELKALLCAREVPRDLDYTAVCQYLTFLWAPTPHTPLAAVRKLGPGEFLRVRGGEISARGRLAHYPAFTPVDGADASHASHTLRGLLEQAVRRQLVADVPLGAFLSGGIDSSAIVAFAARELGGDLQCFTIELQGSDPNEMQEDLPFAKLLARQLQLPLETVTVAPDLVDDLPRMLFALDEPQADPAPLASMYIAARARERNIKVLLSGAGGDDLLGGYRRHQALMQEPLWNWVPRSGRRALAGIAATLPKHRSGLRRVSKALAYAERAPQERLPSYFYWLDPQQSLELLSPFARARVMTEVDEPLRQALEDEVGAADPLSRMLYLEQRFFLGDHNLNYTDKTGMAAGVEIRVPFLDPDLVAFANALPSRWKCHRGTGKWLLKQALTGVLPDTILWRRKVGFGVPLRSWLRGPLRPWTDEMLSASVLARRGIFDPAAVTALVRADRDHRIDASYPIFALICVEIWARQFLDPPTPVPTA